MKDRIGDGMLRLKLVDVAGEAILQMIQNKEYDQNGYLPSEGDMALKLDVSRSTIREAVRSLEVRGFVKRQHGKGVQVANNSVEVMTRSLEDMLSSEENVFDDLLEIRMVLEPVCAQLAAISRTDTDIESLKEFILTMERDDITDEEYYAADLGFHIAIAKASKNKIHLSIITAYTPLLQQMLVGSSVKHYRLEKEFHYHRNILKAVEIGDPELAHTEMTIHLRATDRNRKAASRL